MSELRTLHQRLSQLVDKPAAFSGRARALLDTGDTDVLAAMRTAILETQLPRRLVFRNDADATLMLNVASGRVLAFFEPCPDVTGDVQSEPASLQISTNDPQDASRITEAISIFVAGASMLWLETHRLERKESTVDFGVSVDTIMPASANSSASPQQAAARSVLQTFFTDSTALARAGILLSNGAIAHEHGCADILSRLRILVEEENLGNMATSAMPSDQHAPCQCVIYAGADIERHGLMCLFHAGHLALIAYDQNALGDLIALWQAQG